MFLCGTEDSTKIALMRLSAIKAASWLTSAVPASASVLTVEYKMNLVAPADGDHLVARGKVVRPGRTLIVTQAEVFACKDGKETLCALMQQTIMVMQGKPEKGPVSA